MKVFPIAEHIMKFTQITHIVAVLLVIFSVCVTPISAQPEISVSAEVDRTEMAYEETVTLTYLIEWEMNSLDGSRLMFTSPPDLETDKFRIGKVSSKVSPGTRDGKAIATRLFRYTLIPTGSGEGIIHPTDLSYIIVPDSIPGVLHTPRLTVRIAQPIPVVPESSINIWIWILGALLALGGAGAFFWLKIRGQTKPDENLGKRERIQALLSELKAQVSRNRGDFYTRLYDLIWEAISSRFQLSATRGDTDACVRAIDESNLADSQKTRLSEWITRAAQEKFSPAQGTPGETLRLYNEVEVFFGSQWSD